MANPVPTSVASQIGRGLAYPFRVVAGGLSFNIPDPANPRTPITFSHVRSAFGQHLRPVLRVAAGDVFMDRAFPGIDLDRSGVFELNSEPASAALARGIAQAVSEHIPYVIPEDVGIVRDGATGDLEITPTFRLARVVMSPVSVTERVEAPVSGTE